MPIFLSANILLIHIPKTGGTSIENQLYDREQTNNRRTVATFYSENRASGVSYNLQHFTWADLKQALGKRINDFKLIFTVVRNPYDRLVSEFHSKVKKTDYKSLAELQQKFEEFCDQLTQGKYINDNHQTPQFKFLIDDHEKIPPEIVVLHFETLASDFKDLFGYDLQYHDYKTNRLTTCFHHYTDRAKNLIRKFYQRDFELLNYDPDSIPHY